MLLQKPLEFHQFDSDPGWLYKYLPAFLAEKDLRKRWQIIQQERHKGSIPPQMEEPLRQYIDAGRLQCRIGEQIGAEPDPGVRQICATGLQYRLPGYLQTLAEEEDLPLFQSPQGAKPALKDSFEWAPNLFLAGRLGELFLGPAAGNIAGARLAVRYLKSRESDRL